MENSNLARKTTTRDMTSGPLAVQVLLFSLPLMLGNIFQMLYNTVDSIVVGNFVGKQALAAVGSTTMIVNMVVLFFNGFSVGAGVVISNLFGARDIKKLHRAIETTMATTFILSAFFTVAGVAGVKAMLRLMLTPEDVFDQASTYLTIYIAGISGLLVYNIGSGILRAVGDTTRPLYFLILTSVLNVLLDLLFVPVLKMGIEGVAYATIIAQFISAILTLRLLTGTQDIYRMTWHDLQFDREILERIFAVGLPTGIQSVITSFSNMFVQSYVNFFGSDVMAGWSALSKLEQFGMLPIQSMSMAVSTIVSQNIGAGQEKRARRGTAVALGIALTITVMVTVLLELFAAPAVKLFTPDKTVIELGVMFVRTVIGFMVFSCINHMIAGALRGRGDSKGPMAIMLLTMVGVRQIYLYAVTRFLANTPQIVSLGYPVGWIACSIVEVIYYWICCGRNNQKEEPA